MSTAAKSTAAAGAAAVERDKAIVAQVSARRTRKANRHSPQRNSRRCAHDLRPRGQPGEALQEYGRLVKTILVLASLADEELRARICRQLNRCEELHHLLRAVCSANAGHLRSNRERLGTMLERTIPARISSILDTQLLPALVFSLTRWAAVPVWLLVAGWRGCRFGPNRGGSGAP
jgi:Tn3 transposase DDE domain